jgi:TPR repeat protein
MSLDIKKLQAEAGEGRVVSQSVLGIALLHGYGCIPDYGEALRWLSIAADRGVPRAQVNLGIMYDQGLGVEVDVERARALYELGARRGEFFGCVFLARLLASGRCGETEGAAAIDWYREAASYRGRIEECPELEEATAYVAREPGGR